MYVIKDLVDFGLRYFTELFGSEKGDLCFRNFSGVDEFKVKDLLSEPVRLDSFKYVEFCLGVKKNLEKLV